MGKFIDLTNKCFGRLKVIERNKIDIRKKPAWICICECGNKTVKSGNDLRSGDTNSCGCLRKDKLRIDLTNKIFGKLKVIKTCDKIGKSSSQFWLCKCSCGNEQKVSAQHLTLGQVTHCNKCPLLSEEQILKEAIERFNKSYIKKNGCWEWNKSLMKGYGSFYYKKQITAHRFSYLIYHGPLKKGLFICHHCDNPKCVNPEHLYQGSPKDNSKDAVERQRLPVGERSHFSKLKEEEVKYILTSKERGVDLAKKFGVTEDTISNIRRRQNWKHIL